MTHLLDTSALLTFYFDENGAGQVQSMFDDERKRMAISVITQVEFWATLRSLGREADFCSVTRFFVEVV